MSPLLAVEHLQAGYETGEVLHDVSLTVDDKEIVVLLGANGAGKTTTMRALTGTVRARGRARLTGQDLLGMSARQIVRQGVALVPQGRGTFADLTVADNLLAGAYLRRDRAEIARDVRSWYERFPVLGERAQQKAGTLSGGEQQMLAVARAMMSRPRLLLLDEPSLGLAPLVVQDLFELFARLNAETGIALLIVEQSAELALAVAHRGYVLEAGHTVLSGTAEQLQTHEGVRHAYLGI